MILFIVRPRRVPNHTSRIAPVNVVVWARDREHAKRNAQDQLKGGYGGPDEWDVIPLTAEGDIVHLSINLAT